MTDETPAARTNEPSEGRRPPRRRFPAQAATAAAVLLVVYVALSVVDGVEGVVYTQGVTMQSLDGFEYAGVAVGPTIEYALERGLPLALGVFLSFWVIAPLRPGLLIRSAVLRSVVAALVGVLLVAVTTLVRSVLDNQLGLNPGQGADVDERLYLLIAGGTAHEAWTVFADGVALVIAVGLGTWIAIERRERSRPDA